MGPLSRSRQPSAVAPTDPEVVTDDARWREVVARLTTEDRYALDTEFHREKTYYPKVALLQLAWSDGLVVVDPLEVDLRPLAEVLEGPGTAVLHAADQDLEVLQHACGAIPSRLFDTQVAAGFLGMSTPSLASLHERELGLSLPKADRLTDWLRRPLDADQLRYAATDVVHLLELADRLIAQLEARQRLTWAEDECEEERVRHRGPRDPEDAWRRIKEARSLRGRSRATARAVAAWRERRAAALDIPVRYVMPDLALMGIAHRPPRSKRDLGAIRGLDDRSLKPDQVEELLAVVAEAEHQPPPPTDGRRNELDRALRPAVTLVSAWVSQLARDLELDTALLATRADLEALLRGDDDARLAQGWRGALVGERIRRLVSGEAALSFDGEGGLVLEARSHQSL